jgi:hypothetical protein
MKIIIPNSVIEEAQYFCDKHPDRECSSELKVASWYGSEFDLTGIELHLCDVCLFDMYKHIEKEFGIKPKNIEL